jgi:hypothetical protein
MFISISVMFALVLFGGGVFALQKLFPAQAMPAALRIPHNGAITTINGLNTISQVGSTANILDAKGNPITVDPNPYKIAIAPSDLSPSLKADDILVSNIGNTDHGTTIVKFPAKGGTGQVFNMQTDGVLGPAGLAFDGGMLLVANSTGSNVLAFRPNGTLFTTIKDPLFNGPWGITVWGTALQSRNKMVSFFTANKFDAKILRVDVMPQGNDVPKFHVTQVGQFTQNGTLTKIDLRWLPVLKVGTSTLQDVLLAIDPANNRIAAFDHSSTLQGTGNGMTVFQGTPLNMPGGLAINPFNGDLLVVNLMDNNLVELNPTSGQSVGVKQIDPAMVDNQGNGSALFGVVGVKDRQGNLRVFFTDDNSNTLNVLSASSNTSKSDNSKPNTSKSDNSKPNTSSILDMLKML